MVQITYCLVTLAEVAAAHAIENSSYPEDEAASLQQIQTRIQQASEYFLGAYDDKHQLIGFVNATLTAKGNLDEEAMSRHDPNGKFLCIHSVVVIKAYRGQGIAKKLLQAYVARVVDEGVVSAIMLISKPYLVHFYISCGFKVTRLSPVMHGKDAWMELVLDCTKSRQLNVVVVDAFASKPYEGNPAAVVVMSCGAFDAAGVEKWMQLVAMERNLSETAFVAPLSKSHIGGNEYRLRWFTPACEVDLCGHATLAAAHVLYEDGHCMKEDSIHFHTMSGILTTRYVHTKDSKTAAIEMDFPPYLKQNHDDVWRDEKKQQWANALSVNPSSIIAVEEYGPNCICELTLGAFNVVQPNISLIAQLNTHLAIITCQDSTQSQYDFYSRVFVPSTGLTEDPVCGSAHCALAPYYCDRSSSKPTQFYARQKSHRGGDVRMHLANNRVFITGTAVVTLRGTIID